MDKGRKTKLIKIKMHYFIFIINYLRTKLFLRKAFNHILNVKRLQNVSYIEVSYIVHRCYATFYLFQRHNNILICNR